jgi:hypothetical protein
VICRQMSSCAALGLGLASVILASCTRTHVDTEIATTVVRFAQDSVPLEHNSELTRFSITVVIRNDGHTPVVFGGCGPEAQRDIGGQWQTVWTPICGSPQAATVAPGDSVSLPITVAGFIQPGMEPQLDPRMVPGRYRLRFGISYSDSVNPTGSSQLEALDSPPFTVFAAK